MGSYAARVDEAIPVLRVAEADAAVRWYEVLGYVKEWDHQFEPGLPWFVSIVRPTGARLYLSEHEGDARRSNVVPTRQCLHVDARVVPAATQRQHVHGIAVLRRGHLV